MTDEDAPATTDAQDVADAQAVTENGGSSCASPHGEFYMDESHDDGGDGDHYESYDPASAASQESADENESYGEGGEEGDSYYEGDEEELGAYDDSSSAAGTFSMQADEADFVLDQRDEFTEDGMDMDLLLEQHGDCSVDNSSVGHSASAPSLREAPEVPPATSPLTALQKAGSAVLFMTKAKKKSTKPNPQENMELLRGDVRKKVQGTVKDRSGPSFEERIAEASKRMRKEAVGTERGMKDTIAQSMERGRGRPTSSPFRLKDEEPESVESRATRGRKEVKERTEKYWQEAEERKVRLANREPLYRLEEVAAGFAMLKERQEQRKKELRDDEEKRWGDIAKLQAKVMDRPFCMDNVRTFITPAELRKMASPVKEFGIDIKVKNAVAKKNFKESAWFQQVEEIKRRSNERSPLSEINYKRGGVTPGNHVEVREVLYTADAAKRRMNLFKVGVVKSVDTQGNVHVDWDGNGKPNIVSVNDVKKIRYLPVVEKVRPRQLGPLEKLVTDAVNQPWFKNSDWARTTNEMREKMNNREKLHEISYPPKVREAPPVKEPSPFMLKVQADLAAHTEKKAEAMRADERKQRQVLAAAIKEGLARRDRSQIGMK
eukprot:TRINITY_DN23543_c0_g2_i1.p1 TRINITY_DN23543_c0_g2~~TRINITY_DN23543_c0_g2_i1.p1  ORF type:complete len:605 (-),score=198.74 TRINITY_DN23543_c0_g2_i1:131-1945(-)